MSNLEIEQLKYPIGKFKKPETIGSQQITEWIKTIEEFPALLSDLTKSLSAEKLNWKYRPDGWMIKQVIHHCADSHTNAYIRYKWTLTEDTPTIKAYYEDRWAVLNDSLSDDITISLIYIKALHTKWIFFLNNLDEGDFKKEFVHPEHGRKVSLAINTGIYDWHCNHHLAHIKQAIESNGKYN